MTDAKNGTAPTGRFTPEDLASQWELKAQPNGKWSGPHPTDQAIAKTDGFTLCLEGNAFTNSGLKYTSREVAEMAGILPDEYAPYVEWKARNGHSPAHSPKVSAPSKPSLKSSKVRPDKCALIENVFHNYTDEAGEVLFRVNRKKFADGSKDFPTSRPDGRGGWIFSLSKGFYECRNSQLSKCKNQEEPPDHAVEFPEARRVLYLLHDVVNANVVHIHEGENAADRHNVELKAAGRYGHEVATTAPHGAGKWRDEYADVLKGKQVIVWPDNDVKGHAHAESVCASCAPLAVSVRRISTEGQPEKGDAFERFESGETLDALDALIENTPHWTLKTDEEEAEFEEWGEPRPLKNALFPVPVLDPLLVPTPLRAWVTDCADRIGVAPDYIAVAAICGLASLIGNITIRPKRFDDWDVTPNVWGAVVGNPSVKKSPAISEALKPLSRLKALELGRHKKALKDWETELVLDELDNDTLRSELKKRLKAGASRDELKAYIEKTNEEKANKPVMRTYSVQDGTIEAYTGLLQDNPRGFLIERDELCGWLRNFEKQGHEQDRAFFLEAFNGTAKNQQIERVGRGRVIVPHFIISLVGTIQPQPFAQLIRAASSGAGADGFVSRFQLLVYPDNPPFHYVDRKPDKVARNRVDAIFEALDNLTPEKAGAELDEHGQTYFLRFDDAAQKIFEEWITELELRLPQVGTLMEQHLAKYRSLMPSLALLFHLVSVVDGTASAGKVSEEAANRAAAWCEFLELHARRIYGMAGDGATDGAELISQRFGQIDNPFTLREVHQKGWVGLTAREDVENALARLEDRGWIRGQLDGGEPKRPTIRYYKHPAKATKK